MKTKRLQEMEQYILKNGTVTMEELKDHFQVSMNTIRRDVAVLTTDGAVQKVYGGVSASEKSQGLVPYDKRLPAQPVEKQLICKSAASLVHEGDIIFIDSGTTTLHLMDTLKDMRLTVITNNLEVILSALNCPNIQLIVLPGVLHRDTRSITGEASADFLSTMNTNIAFMAATGVSYGGVTNSSPLEYAIKRAAVQHTERAVLLVSANKFGQTSLLTYAQLKDFERVITDGGIPPEWQKHLASLGVEVDIVEQ